MITIGFILGVLVIAGVLVCFIPVIALPALDIAVGILIVYGIVKLIKKLLKKD